MLLSKIITQLVPPADDTPHKEFDEHRNCPDVATAKTLFETAVYRLQRPHFWKELTGIAGANFQPCHADGKPFAGKLNTGDLLKIEVGGPLPLGTDWVQVTHLIEEAEGEEEIVALQVHPCAPPADTNTEHFFDACATSTWIVCRQGTQVSAHYRGRREVPNNESKNLLRAVRDKVVAAAAVIGLADLQWKALLNGFLGN